MVTELFFFNKFMQTMSFHKKLNFVIFFLSNYFYEAVHIKKI